MSVSGVSNNMDNLLMGNLLDMTATNQENDKRTMKIAGVTTELKFLELDKPVEFTISKEAKEQYRDMLKPGTIAMNESLKELAIIRSGAFLDGFGFEPVLSKLYTSMNGPAAAEGLKIEKKAENLLGAYAKLYDEISQGYDNGTKAFHTYKNGKLTELTKEETIAELDKAYGKISERMEAEEKNRRRSADWYDDSVKWHMEIFDMKESRGRDVAAEREEFLRQVEIDKKRMKNEASDIEIEGFSKKMVNVANDFKEQYGTIDIHTILSEIGLFERLKGNR